MPAWPSRERAQQPPPTTSLFIQIHPTRPPVDQVLCKALEQRHLHWLFCHLAIKKQKYPVALKLCPIKEEFLSSSILQCGENSEEGWGTLEKLGTIRVLRCTWVHPFIQFMLQLFPQKLCYQVLASITECRHWRVFFSHWTPDCNLKGGRKDNSHPPSEGPAQSGHIMTRASALEPDCLCWNLSSLAVWPGAGYLPSLCLTFSHRWSGVNVKIYFVGP